MTEPTKPTETPKAAAAPAAKAKPTFPHLVAALQKPELSFSLGGACLFVAHALVELGSAKLSAMDAEAVRAHALETLRKVPMAWPAFRMGNPMQMVRAFKLYNVACETPEHYQLEVARLTPSGLPKELVEMNRQQMERLQEQLGG